MLAHGGVWFHTGNIQVQLGVETLFIPAKKAHVAIKVVAFRDVITSLEGAEYLVPHDADLPDHSRFSTQDSSNNRVEILSPAERPAW